MFGSKKTEEETTDVAADPEAAQDSTTDEKGEVKKMKRGDYMVHVFVEQAKNIKWPGSADPIVEMTVLGKKEYSSAQKQISAVDVAEWNEHIFYEFKNKETKELEAGKIEIKLVNQGLLKDQLIGYYEFDLNYIYLMPKHAMLHKWIVMSNPESENFGEVTGYLKLSIAVSSVEDEQIQIEIDPNPEVESIIQPPSIKPEFYQLKIRFFRAEKIVPMDFSFKGKGSVDAYFKMKYRTMELRTTARTQEYNGHIDINEEFLVPAQLPVMGGRMFFQVYDKDKIKDELIGSFWLDQKDYVPSSKGETKPKNCKFEWKNIYGAPLKCSGKVTDKMNEDPSQASFWKGRVLIQVIAEKTDKPEKKAQQIKESQEFFQKEVHEKFCVPKKFDLMLQINSAIALPSDKEKYSMEFRVAEHEIKSDVAVLNKTGYNRFNFKTENLEPLEMPYVDEKDIGWVYIYLVKPKSLTSSEKRICFAKFHSQDLLQEDPEVVWMELQPDLAIGECKDQHRAGIVSLKATIKLRKDPNVAFDWRSQPRWSKKMPKRFTSIITRVYLFQARDLPAADSNGSSDPFIKFIDCENGFTTQVIWESTNPIFYETVDLSYEGVELDDMPPIILHVYDKDKNTLTKDSADYLARALIFPKELVKDLDYVEAFNNKESVMGNQILPPKWYPLQFDSSSPKCGEVLLSLAIGDIEYKWNPRDSIDLSANVAKKDFDVNLQILGLRDLQSPGMLPIKKAFISLNLKSMVPPSVGSNLSNIQTEPKAAGPNPTLNTLMSFNMPLPKEQLYCPRLQCAVYDCIFSGFNQPLVGTFVIDIGQIMVDLKMERKKEIAELQLAIKELQKRVEQRCSISDVVQDHKAQEFVKKATDKMLQNQQKETKKETEKVAKALKKSKTQSSRQSQVSVSINNDDDENQLLLGGDDGEQDRLEEYHQEQIEHALKVPHSASNRSARASLYSSKASEISTKEECKGVNLAADIARKEIRKQIEEENERAERDKEDLMKQEFPEYERKMHERYPHIRLTQNIVYALYQKNKQFSVWEEIADLKPPQSTYLPIGYDPCPADFEELDYSDILDNPEWTDQVKFEKIAAKQIPIRQKHYRLFFNKELEFVEQIMPTPTPFKTYDLKRGQSRGASAGFFASLTGDVKQDSSGQVSDEKVVGRFKAIIEVETKSQRTKYENTKKHLINDLSVLLGKLAKKCKIEDFVVNMDLLETAKGRAQMREWNRRMGIRDLDLTQKLGDLQSDVILQHMLLKKCKTQIRVYVLNGYNLASRDVGSDSDPYLRLSVGDKVLDNREEYQIDQPNPDFFKKFEFEAIFPGCPPLVIEAMDYDMLFGDELIGSSTLDLEDRYFMVEWKAVLNKPVETRKLYHPGKSMPQGNLRMWVEINETKVKPEELPKVFDITPEPKQDVEVRVCIFDTKEVVMMDAEGTSDVFIRAFFDSKKALETDTHYRCQTGTASFNYRLLYREQNPRHNSNFTIQCYDRDFFKSNDIIGSGVVDLKQVFEHVKLTDRPIILTKAYYDEVLKEQGVKMDFKDNETFWVEMKFKDLDTGKITTNGYVRVQIEVCPVEHAEKNVVGAARDEPNHSPFLEPPKGRLSFSLNPWTMFCQLVGPAMRRKIICYVCSAFCAILCVYICIMALPVLLANLVSSIF